jgi:signal peptidase I
VRPILVIWLVVASARSAIADWHDVPTGSMKPSIVEGDRIVVNKLAYDVRVPFLGRGVARNAGPARGDVVVLRSPADGTRLVKRVVGLPGDRIELIGNRLIVNGTPAAYEELDRGIVEQVGPADRERHQFAAERVGGNAHPVMVDPARGGWDFGPITIPADHYVVMGDNRDNSADSRAFGFVSRQQIEGRVVGVAASFDTASFRPRWQRFFRKMV